ncbi:MAG: NAD-binding protein [Candidatus Marsarchaeota archaeon]|nr:NAD-binding protein [Candidatus Marsarchaeota archaeon]MCL5413330.1 NAD-binding protein [Candidatus Marsarchaeota archaeon]
MKKSEIFAYAMALAIVLAYGIGGSYYLGHRGGFNVPVTSLTNAVYFTLVTISTIGYGDIYPVSESAKIFVMVLIVVGIGVFLSTVVAIAGDFMTTRIETISGRMTAFEKRSLSHHIILVGSNTTNLYLAEKLSEKNEKFIIVTNDSDNAEHLKRLGFRAYVVDSTSEVEMKELSPEKAKAIVIDLKDSSRSIYALLVAKEVAGDAKIVIIAPTKSAEHHIRRLSGGKALVINPADIAASAINESLFK